MTPAQYLNHRLTYIAPDQVCFFLPELAAEGESIDGLAITRPAALK